MSEPAPFQMPFLEHLEEFRKRLFRSAVALFVAVVLGYFASGLVLDLITAPVGRLVFLSPPEAFITRLKVAFILGLSLSSPFIIYQFWRFVKPALLGHEVRYVTLAVLFSTFFFLGGIAFAYFVMVPIGMRFFLSFETPDLEAMISIDRYVTFVTRMLLAAGLIFQVPVVIFFLTKLGIVKPKTLRKHRRVAVVGTLVVAAVLTPPDVFTQLLMTVPLLALYELGILGSVIAARSRRDPADS